MITEENLHDFVGKPLFTSDRMYEVVPEGVVMGLAWTSMGGATLYIEAMAEPVFGKEETFLPEADGGDTAIKPPITVSGGALYSTGQMGDVMKESTLIAYSVAKAYLQKLSPGNTFFARRRVHMHVPEGAMKKDGPSAGITMVTALLSLALKRPAKNDVAMTGEITLTGKVLAIGGVKEKTIAARRSNVHELIFPAACKRDFDELPEHIREGVTAHFVDHYDQVFKVMFPALEGTQQSAPAPAASQQLQSTLTPADLPSSAPAVPVAAAAAAALSGTPAPRGLWARLFN